MSVLIFGTEDPDRRKVVRVLEEFPKTRESKYESDTSSSRRSNVVDILLSFGAGVFLTYRNRHRTQNY